MQILLKSYQALYQAQIIVSRYTVSIHVKCICLEEENTIFYILRQVTYSPIMSKME